MMSEKSGDIISEHDLIFGNEDLYRAIFENVHDGIYRSTPEGKIITANPALVRMLGYDSEEELKKLNIAEDIYVSAAQRDVYKKEIREKGRLRDLELDLRKKDGNTITVLENSHSLYDKTGNLVFYEGTLTDITSIKNAEKALRLSEERYRTLIETLHDGLSLFDLNGRLIYANIRKREMLGYDDECDLMKMNAFEMIHPEDQPKAQKIYRDIRKKGTIPGIEVRVLRKDRSWFWAEFNATVLKDADGNPAFILDSMRDISERKQAEEQLMVLKHSIDVHYDGAYWLDVDNRIIYVNNSACRDTGYRRDELIGQDLSQLNPLATKEVLKIIWDKLRKDGSFTAEAVHRRKNGSIYPVEIVTSYLKFGGKEYACGFARDITERKSNAEEMRLRLQQMRQIIDLVPSYIFAKDVDGKFLLANKAVADVFGLSPEEIQGKNDSDYGATKEQIKWYRKHDLKVIRQGAPVHIPEEQVLRKDGTLGWFQTVKIPYRHPGYDKPAILGVATEITQRKEAEDELRKSETRFRKLFNSHSAIKLLVDPDSGSIVDANKAASEFFGWPVSKLKKMRISDISALPGQDILKNIRNTIRNASSTFETTSRLANGSVREVEVYASKINIDDKVYLHSIVHDITDKKKFLRDLIAAKEKAEESDKIKTAFLHNISHEIRTPMNAIVGFSSLLESQDLTEEARRQYVDIISRSSQQLLSIITDIVDISNIDAGQVKLTFKNVVVSDLFRQIYDQYRLKAESAKLEFRYIMPENNNARLRVRTDETKLIQIISNLLDNSFKFTRKGSIRFGCCPEGAFLGFFVTDTGIGIRRGNYKKIFDRFFQGENYPENKTEGTGLGLSICKGYVELLGGKISVSSRYGKGSEFRFTLPLTRRKISR